jgi:hypothetical protein
MTLACLPMYDLHEARPALDALWAGLARHLRAAGVAEVPATLERRWPADAIWGNAELLLSQSCGADLTGAWAAALTPVATPCYRAPGCAGASYASFVVVPAAAPGARLEELRGKVAAINHTDSHSGSNALRALVAPLARDGRFFGAVEVSGSHVRSLAMVASGAADVAAIDCVTHALLARHRPAALAGTRVLCRTAAAPAPPFVTRAGAAPALVARLRAALHAAIADPALAGARADLLLDGIEILPRAAYGRIPAFARFAARHGCDPLGA